MNRLPARIGGVVLLAIAVVFFDPISASPLHRLVLPVTMALAAWLMVQNAAAVLLGATLLTTIHAEPQNPDWIVGRAYPALALACGAALGYIAWQRFRRRIEATREARWRSRKGG